MNPDQYLSTLRDRINSLRQHAADLEEAIQASHGATILSAFGSEVIATHLGEIEPDLERVRGRNVTIRLSGKNIIPESVEVEYPPLEGVECICLSISGENDFTRMVYIADEDAVTLRTLLEQVASLVRGAANRRAQEIIATTQEG